MLSPFSRGRKISSPLFRKSLGGLAPSLATSGDGSIIEVTNLGNDTFSITVSGSSTPAFNDTYTHDTQSRPLTGTLLETEGELCLKLPDQQISNDVNADGLADAGDTLAMSRRGLWIYTGDYPGDPSYQFQANGVDIEGATDQTGFVLTSSEMETNVTLKETFGGNFVSSLAIAVQAGSPLETDPSYLYWFDPTNVVTSDGTLTDWPDNRGNGITLTQAGALARPTWDAANSRAVFAGSEILAAADNTAAVSDAIAGGGSAVIFIVAELDASGQAVNSAIEHMLWAEDSDANKSSQNSIAATHYTYGTPDTTIVMRNRKFGSNGAGQNSFDDNTSRNGVKLIYEFEVTQTTWAIRLNGADLVTGASAPENFAQGGADWYIAVGGLTDKSTMSSGFKGAVHEVYGTGDVSASHVGDVRSALATKHGITL